MAQAVLRIGHLPEGAVDAASAFYREWADQAGARFDDGTESLVLVMASAPYDHTDWRLAAARDLARAAVPGRVNIIASDDEEAIAAALSYLERAPGVTGQYLPLDGEGAGNSASRQVT